MNKSQSSSRAASNVNGPNDMRYGIDDKVPKGLMIILAIQHVFGMFGATVLVPILINQAVGTQIIGISTAIFASGVATLIYQRCTKKRSPVYLGSSFAFIAPIAAAYLSNGLGGAMTASMVVGLIYVLAAVLILLIGTGWLNKVLPPVVTGPMLMIIGFGLAPSAVSQMGIDGSAATNWRTFSAAMVTLGAAIVFMVGFKKFLHGFLNIIPFLAAIIVGYIYSSIIGIVDFQPAVTAPWFAWPEWRFIGVHWKVNFGAVLTVAPVALATISEHIGDHKALSVITGRDLLDDPGLALTLLGDGLATFFAALMGMSANTTYGENSAIVGMTKVASVRVIRLAAIFAMILSFCGKFTAAISTIPAPVLGGVSLLLYGFIGLNGAKDIIQARVNYRYPRNIVISGVMLGLGLGGAVLGFAIGEMAISFSGMSLAAIFGVILNLFIPEDKDEEQEKRQIEHDEELLKILKGNRELLGQAEGLLQQKKAAEELKRHAARMANS